MLNKTIFAQNMAGLCEVYNRELTKTLQNIYYAILKDMQDDDFKQAIKRLLKERVFATFPKPAEILELSAIKKVATVEVDEVELKAKELIALVHGMNESVYQTHIKTGVRFEDLINRVLFPKVDDETIATLDNIKPYFDHKQLICNINHYQTSQEQLDAFMSAIKYQPSEAVQIGKPLCGLRIEG